jgi:ferric-dicitrate binding protein FerR (iron transport regulator)
MNRESQKEQSIEAFLTKEPVFDLNEIDVPAAEKKVFRRMKPDKPFLQILITGFRRTASIIVVPLAILSAYLLLNDRDSAGADIWQEVIVPYGTFSQINLSDGTKVWLNSGSSLKYPATFKKKHRQVHLTGEGYFEVTSDRTNPFLVQTEQILLTATGTTFNIEAYPADSMIAVTMIEGKIDVAFGQASPVKMTTGQRVTYNRTTGKGNLIPSDAYKWCAWKNGLMIFRDDPLAYVFKRLEQTFNVAIDVKNPEIAGDLYRATFEDESLDEILRLLERTAPIRFVRHKREKDTDNLYVKKQIDVYKKTK